MRVGTPAGAASSTKLLLNFEHGSLADWSGQANVVTATPFVAYQDGQFGWGVTFPPEGHWTASIPGHYVEVADSTALNISGDMCLNFWLRRSQASGAEQVVMDRDSDPTGTPAWRVSISTTGQIVWLVRDAGGTADTLTSGPIISNGRLYHIRLCIDVGATMHLDLDGQRNHVQTTARASIKSTGLGPLRLGQLAAGGSPFYGTISNLRIRAAADTSLDTLSPNIRPARVTSRLSYVVPIDLGEDLSAETWTTSGTNYYLDAFDLQPLIDDEIDVVGVEAAITASDTPAALTRKYNETDLGADGQWFWDEVNGRIYSSKDPTSYNIFRVLVRYRASQIGRRLGGRYLHPTVIGLDKLERRTPLWFHSQPAGGGGMLSLATQYADHPSGLFEEAASAITWLGSQTSPYLLSDHMPAAERITLGRFIVDERPRASPDVTTVRLAGLYARFHLRDMGAMTVTLDEYPDAPEDSDGAELQVVFGREHRNVPCVLVNATTGLYRITPPGFKIARINSVFEVPFGSAVGISDIDLDGGQFTSSGSIPTAQIIANIDGYAETVVDQTDPGPITTGFGSAADVEELPTALIQSLIKVYGGFTAADFGATLADTATRALVPLRFYGHFSEPSAAVEKLARIQEQGLVFLYPSRAGLWEVKDLNKADASVVTIRDFDVLAEVFDGDYTQLAKELRASTWEYRELAWDDIRLGTDVHAPLNTRHNSQRTWTPPGGMCFFLTKGSLTDWLEKIHPQLESPTVIWSATLSRRFLPLLEVMDPIDLEVSSRPAALSNRFRVLRLDPTPQGLQVEMVSEDLFPADGTSAAPGRAALAITTHFDRGSAAGIALADTAGAWAPVDPSTYAIFRGDIGSFAASTHGFVTSAIRVGGTSLLFRLKRLSDNAVLTTQVTTHGTSLGFQAGGAFSNVPTIKDRIVLEYKTEGGATGTWHSSTWESSETSPSVDIPYPTHSLYSWYDADGVAITATGLVIGPRGGIFTAGVLPAGSIVHATIYLDKNTAGGTPTVVLMTMIDTFSGTGCTWSIGASADNFYTTTFTSSTTRQFQARATIPSGSMTLYGIDLTVEFPWTATDPGDVWSGPWQG